MPLPPSAGDWTRYKKLTSAIQNEQYALIYNRDITNVRSPGSCVAECQSRAGIRRDQDFTVGTGRTRREASKWTDYIAAQHTDFVTVSEQPVVAGSSFGSFGRQLTQQRICGSNTICPPQSIIQKLQVYKSGIYQHSRIV